MIISYYKKHFYIFLLLCFSLPPIIFSIPFYQNHNTHNYNHSKQNKGKNAGHRADFPHLPFRSGLIIIICHPRECYVCNKRKDAGSKNHNHAYSSLLIRFPAKPQLLFFLFYLAAHCNHLMSCFIIKAHPDLCERTHICICGGNMCGMNSIALKRCFAFKRGVKHHIRI